MAAAMAMAGLPLPDNSHLPMINKAETILGVNITFLAIAMVTMCLRLYVRHRERLWGWDDLFVLLAGIATLIGSILTSLMPSTGMGKHLWTLSESQLRQYFQYIWASNVSYTASTTFIKLAILFQYLRLFDLQGITPRRLAMFLIAFISVWGTAFFLFAVFACRPIRKNWDIYVPGKCVGWGSKEGDPLFASFMAHGSSNMLLDILVLTLPIPFLKGLRAQGKTRVGLITLFTMGSIVASLSVCRIVALAVRRAGTVPIFDPTYAAPAVYLFSVLEINFAILCASIPIFWPLVSSIALGKILVVNEIEVHTSDRSSHEYYYDRSRDGAFGDFAENGGRGSRMSINISAKTSNIIAKTTNLTAKASNYTRPPPRVHRPMHRPTHTHKRSNSSGHKNIEIGARSSHESSRGLNQKSSQTSISSQENARNESMEQDSSRYIPAWAVAGLNKRDGGDSGRNDASGTYNTIVGRAELPFDPIKPSEK